MAVEYADNLVWTRSPAVAAAIQPDWATTSRVTSWAAPPWMVHVESQAASRLSLSATAAPTISASGANATTAGSTAQAPDTRSVARPLVPGLRHVVVQVRHHWFLMS